MNANHFFQIFSVIVLSITACKPEAITPSEVISNVEISNRSPWADGTSVIDISVNLNKHADADKRNVIFRTSSGVFLPANDTIITQKANFENGNLVAKVKFKVPATARTVYFTIRPEIRSAETDFILSDSLETKTSIPTDLIITPSAFSVFTNYAGEIQVSALLKNGTRNASSDCQVIFEDYFPNGTPVNGRYRQKREKTDGNATVSTYYSPGNIPAGTSFFLKCTYIDTLNKKTSIKDSSLITTVQP